MSPYIPVFLERQVRECFGGLCAYCRSAEALMAVTFEIEHIVPVSSGGATDFANLALACPTCNRHKATRQSAQDPHTGELVRLFHPQEQRWVEHFSWVEEGARMLGLTAPGRASIEALRMNRPVLVRLRSLWTRLGVHPPSQDGAGV